MKTLSPVDQLFLYLEKRQQPMHVAGLQLFSFPEGAGPKYVSELARSIREYSSPEPPFNQRLTRRFGQYQWMEDQQFDMDHHFRHEALPKPGRIRELLSLVSAEHSNLLDRERPLWEAHLIEGIRGRQFALYTKVHHSVVDGISAMRMGMRALSPDPEERDLPPVWAYKPKKRGRGLPSNPVDAVSSLARLTTGASRQIATVPALAREIYSVTQKAKDDPNFVSIFQAPDTILNQCITGSRRFAAQSYSLDRLKRLSGAFNCTLNDVVLSMCGHALREYLISQNALPDRPLIAMVPMSLRKDDSAGGNQIAMILANLGTHICDPANRLRVVQASVREAKKRFSQMSPEEILNFTALSMAPTGLNLLTGLAPKWRAFNVIISNVPGPREPLYWNGARLEGMYPVSIVLDRIALNMTLTSYRGQIEFGLIACRRTLPSMQRLLDYLEQSIRELEIAAGFK
ncbi:MAG: wax ester/triacylglycerol synthase family O-acyltransferase [Alcanivorax sp.]|jgi:diacylglycerol O-acyltransferase|uniref:WS/DGAT/MGAT family O-acyltransferase n=1 Tax=Alloalcanivorax TaxID=3020832 RepID=UPI00079B26B4|nr:wax ester/triacylglycerol synthase family O-acyltransferase [Alloalcanivorax venustensis]KXJ43629.1 MAG: acetyltransferase [Alcanivorax sp. Nap_24]MAD69203.1 wax ester/triacylglycerol synthase family O-acyltransferase [Alcanivorax sp.]MEA3259856.1 wax ester/triacylglycerol synthase family O-acyltransferase [Pseudomonadota bacterium]SMO47010.1 diacylglycerol O-acyltransferase [Alcanivorax sp. DSM 26295]MAK21552.1 wax ester/triacylglycerol synthase family O-acyltransferase [Alcanivorax sp.]|tara:strand:- start:108577 stop:109950 length:1374 start_codon:yes stop_codon:yes gene_type:complete